MSKEFNRQLGKILKQKRIEAKLTQQQVADTIGRERSAYTYYETGRSAVDIETFKAICEAIHADPYAILREIL